MAKRVQIVGMTTAATASFVGLEREVTVDTDRDELCVHTGGGAGTNTRIPTKTLNDTYYQAISTLLTAIAALSTADGVVAKTGAATVALRTITGTANQISVANGGGAGGNPTLSLPSAITAPGSIAATTTVSDSIGNVRKIPRSGSAKTGAYTLATTDVGQIIEIGSGGSVEIPDATFADGDIITIWNNTTGDRTITNTITTAYIAGTDADKATFTLATRGFCTLRFSSGTVVTGAGNIS